MRIVYLHQYFKTPEEGGAVRSFYVASKLVEEGHTVDLITSHNSADYYIKRVNGVRVHYCPVPYDNKFGTLKRIWSFLRFAFTALDLAKRLKPDLCYATSTPLSIGWIALRLNKRKGTPFIFEVRDLWPEAPKQMGVLRNRILLRIASRLEKRIYYQADKIVALSPGIAQSVNTLVGREKIIMVPNFSNCELVQELEQEGLSRLKPDVLRIAYTGALGKVNNMSLLGDVIRLISQTEGIELCISGEGKYAHQVEEWCGVSTNAKYVGHLSKQETYELLLNSDICLTTFLDLPVLETNSPNKFFDGLACGAICLVNNSGWVKELVEENECGFQFNRDNFRTIIELLRDDPGLVETYKLNATNLSRRFDHEKLTQEIAQMVKDNFTPATSSPVYNQTE